MQTIERDLWITALRSGKYHQGRHALSSGKGGHQDQLRCLGVCCDIFREELGLDVVKRYINDELFDVAYSESATVLPLSVANYVGLKTREGRFSKYRHGVKEIHECEALTSLNDDGATFAEIADILEDNEDLLFDDVVGK